MGAGAGSHDALTPAVAGQLLASISDGLRSAPSSVLRTTFHTGSGAGTGAGSGSRVGGGGVGGAGVGVGVGVSETPAAVLAALTNLLDLLQLCSDADAARPALLLARARAYHSG